MVAMWFVVMMPGSLPFTLAPVQLVARLKVMTVLGWHVLTVESAMMFRAQDRNRSRMDMVFISVLKRYFVWLLF